MNELGKSDWIHHGNPLCLLGDSGTRKSHLLINLGAAAAEEGYLSRTPWPPKIVNEHVEAAKKKVSAKAITR